MGVFFSTFFHQSQIKDNSIYFGDENSPIILKMITKTGTSSQNKQQIRSKTFKKSYISNAYINNR